MEPIQLFVPTFHTEECLEQIRECLDRGWTGLGYKTVEFEQKWCEYTKLPYAHMVNSATAGLHLAVKLLKDAYRWPEDSEIITTPLTFISTNHAILYEHLTPVFADVDQYLCLDPESVERHITGKTRAVMYVGMGGNTGQLCEIQQICKYYNLRLILDAAHMAGTQYRGVHVGSEADIAVFSFQAVKNLPTADSGMLCCKDAETDTRARKLTWLGIDKDTFARTQAGGTYKWLYDVPEVGYKYHSNSIMAALGIVGLKYLEQDNITRRELCAYYDQMLIGHDNIQRVPIAPYCLPSRHLYQIMVENRDDVMLELNERGIYPGVHYRENTQYAMYRQESLIHAHRASERLISLPLHLRLSREDVRRVSRALIQIVHHDPNPDTCCTESTAYLTPTAVRV